MPDLSLAMIDNPVVSDRIRGFPAGHEPLPLNAIGGRGWKPFDGSMQLPLISLDRDAFAGNVDLMMRYVREQGVEIAPHAKTPMSPALAEELVEAGAWGATVADIRQASVMLEAGFRRLILANEIGGPSAAKRLASLLSGYADAEVHVFVDSVELAEALATVWSGRNDLPRLGLLPEAGAARAGARSRDAALAVADTILDKETSLFQLTGIASYEGAAATPDADETADRIAALMDLTADMVTDIRNRVGPQRKLIVTAGGSVYFDMVVGALKPVLQNDPDTSLVLRSGAIFFHDHGVYERGLAALDRRSGFRIGGATASAAEGFVPALRVWAEVLSRPEPGLAICGMGMRDVAIDQGFPRPLTLYRDGAVSGAITGAEVVRLNDQHAFVTFPDGRDVRIGDVIEFGISHPCTCLDRHAILYGLDADRAVTAAYPTSFG